MNEISFEVLRDVQPGDLVIVRVAERLTEEAAERLSRQMREQVAKGVGCLVIDSTVTITLSVVAGTLNVRL